MKIDKTTKKKTVTETITHQTDFGFNIVETIVNGKSQGVMLLPGKEAEKRELYPVLLNLPEDWVEKYTEFYDLYDYQIIPQKVEDVEEDKVYFMYEAGHMLFDKDKRIISIPQLFNYIDSLVEKEPNGPIYAELIKLLKKHPYVLELKEAEIPYYNRDFPGQKGIAYAKVYLPQKKYEELYEKCKDEKFWSCELTNYITMSFSGNTGVYGKEIDKLLKKYWKKDAIIT